MHSYTFLNGETAELKALSPEQRRFIVAARERADGQVQALTRWKLRHWWHDFIRETSPHVQALASDRDDVGIDDDALFDPGEENEDELFSPEEKLLRRIFPGGSEVPREPNPVNVLVRNIVDDIRDRIGIAAGVVSTEGVADETLKAKEWSGLPEEPFYLFHLGREPDTRAIVSRFSRVEVIDARDGGYRDALVAEHAQAGRTFLGGFAACDPRETAAIDSLRERHGEELDRLFVRAFSEGLYDTFHGSFGDTDSYELHIVNRVGAVLYHARSLPGIADDELETLKKLFVEACKTGRFWGGQASVLDVPDDAELPPVEYTVERILRTLEQNRHLWTGNGAAVVSGCIRLAGYVKTDLALLRRACELRKDPAHAALVGTIDAFLDLNVINPQDWSALHRDLQLSMA